MNCANHPEAPAAAYCRDCGKPMCPECRRPARGTIYCAEHVPSAPVDSATAPVTYTAASPYTAPAPGPASDLGAHPAVALILGFIPGVGAIYNGQYAKGLIHVVVFGLLVSLANSHTGPFEPLVGVLIAAWIFYMAFEAFHTARNRRRGAPVEEFSNLFDVREGQSTFPAGAILLIAVGFILLLHTADIIDMEQLERYWPVGLIALGASMLFARLRSAPRRSDQKPDPPANNAEVKE